MSLISTSLLLFSQKLKNGEVLTCNRGKWNNQWRVVTFFRGHDRELISCAKELSELWDRVERKQYTLSDALFSASEALLVRMKPGKEKTDLQRRVLACRMRLVGPCGERSQVDFTNLLSLALAWKKEDKLNPYKQLSDRDRRKLEKVACHREFSKLIKENPEIRSEFFKWALRDNNKIKPFMYFPGIQERLKTCLLSGRLGYNGCKALKVDLVTHDVTLLFNGKPVSILDENKIVELENRWSPKIREIFESFKSKNVRTGNVELLKNGVTNWNSHELGRFNGLNWLIDRVDVSKPNWWEGMPVLKEMTAAELCYHMNLTTVEPGKWVVAAKATRERPNLDINKSHGYLEIAIPDPTTGLWRLYAFGKYAKDYPTGFFGLLGFIAGTVEARIQGFDENVFYGHRQQASHPICCTSQEGEKVMGEVGKWIARSRSSNVIFQFVWENCAWWPEYVLRAALVSRTPHQLYSTYILHSEPLDHPLKGIFKTIVWFPRKYWNFLVKLTDIVFLSYRGKYVQEDRGRVFKSVATSDFRKNFHIFLPARLHQNQPESIRYGHQNPFYTSSKRKSAEVLAAGN
jgi:hypothetical protein